MRKPAAPQLIWTREIVHGDGPLHAGCEVMLDEALPVRAVGERHIERHSVVHGLLQARSNAMVGILSLNNGER